VPASAGRGGDPAARGRAPNAEAAGPLERALLLDARRGGDGSSGRAWAPAYREADGAARRGRQPVTHVAEVAAAPLGRGHSAAAPRAGRERELVAEVAVAAPAPLGGGRDLRLLAAGAALALAAGAAVQWLGHLPWWQRASRRFIWWSHETPAQGPYGAYTGALPACPRV